MSAIELGRKLGRGIDGGVDVASELSLRVGQGSGQLGEGDLADDQNVHVAGRRLASGGDGAEDECHANPPGQRAKGLRQEPGGAEGLQHDAPQLLVDRGRAIGGMKDLGPDLPAEHDADPHQPLEFAMHRADPAAAEPGDLADVERLLGPPKQHAQNRAARLAQQHPSKFVRFRRYHNGNKRYLMRNGVARHGGTEARRQARTHGGTEGRRDGGTRAVESSRVDPSQHVMVVPAQLGLGPVWTFSVRGTAGEARRPTRASACRSSRLSNNSIHARENCKVL